MRTALVHRLPINGSRAYPCCGRTSFEIPRTDRISWNPTEVTCSGRVA